jgi:glycosyltransferase involved in cell wall biosynthesis
MLHLSNSKILFLIPCHNESNSIGLVIEEIRRNVGDCRILVIDNASSDDTSLVASSYGVEIVKERKKGKGFAFLKGLSLQAHEEILVLVDGDFTYDLSGIREIIHKFWTEEYDMAIGSRQHPSSYKVSRFGHKTFNFFFSTLFRVFFKIRVEDALSGLRIMRKDFISNIKLERKGFELETLLNYHAVINSSTILNFPCVYRKRVENSFSKLNTLKDALNILKLFLSLIIDYRAGQFFGFLSLIFLFLSFFVALDNITLSLVLFTLFMNLALAGAIIKRITQVKKLL